MNDVRRSEAGLVARVTGEYVSDDPGDPEQIALPSEHTVRRIEHENGQVSNRITWLLTLNGFLFAAYGLAFGEVPDELLPRLTRFQHVVCIVGVASAVLAAIGMWGAYRAINAAKSEWLTCNPRRVPRPFVSRSATIMGRTPSFGLCITLLSVWAYLLVSTT